MCGAWRLAGRDCAACRMVPVLSIDPRDRLSEAAAAVAGAVAALDDEREGDFTRCVERLADAAGDLAALVRAW